MSYKTIGTQIEDDAEASEEERHKAALLVCGRSADAAEAAELMSMLGLFPKETA